MYKTNSYSMLLQYVSYRCIRLILTNSSLHERKDIIWQSEFGYIVVSSFTHKRKPIALVFAYIRSYALPYMSACEYYV